MTFRSIYNEEQGGFGPLRALQTVSQAFPNVGKNEITQDPIYRQK